MATKDTQERIRWMRGLLSQAQQAWQAGSPQQAEHLIKQVLKQMPEAWEARQMLGMLYVQSGKHEEAAREFRRITDAHPANAANHANLANTLAECGLLDEAVSEFNRALALDDGLVGARIALGEALRRMRRLDKAIVPLKQVLDRDKRNHAAFNVLGLVYRDLGDIPRALECFEFASEIASNIIEYRSNLAVAMQRAELHLEAIEQFDKLLSLKADWLDMLVLKAESLKEVHRFDEALNCLDRARKISPNHPELLERRGFVYLEMNDCDHAIADFHHSDQLAAGRYMGMMGLGRAYQVSGDTAKAESVYELFINRYQDDAQAYFLLSGSRKFKAGEAIIDRLRVLTETSQDFSSSVKAHFALGKMYDDTAQWDDAFAHYARANQLQRASFGDLSDNWGKRFLEIESLFTEDFLQQLRNYLPSNNSELPVFIVGMPRSGTTLVEQIVSSHPDVIGGGELSYWGKAAASLTAKLNKSVVEKNNALSATVIQIAEQYLELLSKVAGPATKPRHVTNKMPHDFMSLGIISLIFPNAKILHCNRDAMDNSLSVFFHEFNERHVYATDLSELGLHYRGYARLMEHWRKVLPTNVLDINYENLVADPKYWSRKIIEHVGLNWDDACLTPYKQQRAVKTPSLWQVRQPVYNTSVERWRHYERYLEPLKQALSCQ